MKKYYVYELIDPRDSSIFYVGKGKDKRMYSHVSRVKHGKIPNRNKHLYNKIKQILDIGCDVIYKQIFFTDDNDEAFKIETKRIEEVGIKNLCNLFSSPPTKEEIYKLRSKNMKGKILSEETKQKIRNSLKGHVVSERTKQKISNTKTGKKLGKCSESKREKISLGQSPDGKWKTLISPQGKIVEVKIIIDVCKKYNLNPTSISRVLRGDKTSYKGWKVLNNTNIFTKG